MSFCEVNTLVQKMISLIDKKLKPVNPIQFGYESCKKSHAFGPAVRPFVLIHFVVSGSGRFEIQGRRYNISKGDMFVIPPHVETYYEASDKDPWSYVWIGFETDFDLTLEDKITCPEAARVFEEMKRCEDFKAGRNLFLVSKIWELFAILENREQEDKNYVKKAKSIIHSEYMMGVGVEDIAKRLNIDRSYFSAVFKKAEGISPAKYLMRYRMTMAESLFKNGQMSVATVAHSVGYVDVFNFSKAFKKYFGTSPLEYKKGKST